MLLLCSNCSVFCGLSVSGLKMSSCLTGAGRAYGFDLEIIKSPSTSSSILSNSSSPSSTLSESSNSPVAISTRKSRTPRKRPNQTYNEAAALLSTACPKIFTTKSLTKISKFSKSQNDYFLEEPPELLFPFKALENSCLLLHQPNLEKPSFRIEPIFINRSEMQCKSPAAIDSQAECNSLEDFDTESMLDEEMGEGIDSIMGNLSVESNSSDTTQTQMNTCYGYPMGLGLGNGFDFGFGMRSGVKALRTKDEGNWWSFPTVNIADITPKLKKVTEKKKKKLKDLASLEPKKPESKQDNSIPIPEGNSNPEPSPRLLLKLNYDEVLNAWSDRGSPLPEEITGSDSPGGNDIHARLAQIDLFSENGGLREASVMRYKEKRRTRLFSKKIRYQVRKVNADQRPRMKGRFVRRPNSPTSEG